MVRMRVRVSVSLTLSPTHIPRQIEANFTHLFLSNVEGCERILS